MTTSTLTTVSTIHCGELRGREVVISERGYGSGYAGDGSHTHWSIRFEDDDTEAGNGQRFRSLADARYWLANERLFRCW